MPVFCFLLYKFSKDWIKDFMKNQSCSPKRKKGIMEQEEEVQFWLFRRAGFGLFRDLLGRVPLDRTLEGRGS